MTDRPEDTNEEGGPRSGPEDASPAQPHETDDAEVRSGDGDIRRRASVALLIAGSWGLLNLVIAFVGNLVLARLLDPRSFGIVAVGTTVMIFCSALAEGGLASALLRRREPATEPELRTLAGVQLLITGGLAVTIGLVAFPFGEIGRVTAVMVWAVPIASLQAPGRIGLAREMKMQQITTVEAASVIGYYTWSITTVAALGLGVWGLATGTIIRAVSGTIAMALVPGGGFRRPTLELLRTIGPLVRFGVRYQANWIAIIARDQGLNAVIGVVAGVYTLGLWSLTTRLMQVPAVLYDSIGRVTFPAMTHLLAADRDPRPPIERTARLAAAASAILLSGFTAGAPGYIPFLFGERWNGVVSVIPSAAMGLMISGVISAAGVGYLFAAGKPGAVLRSSIAYALVWIATTAVLLPFLGLKGVGLGWIAGATAESIVLVRAVRRSTGAGIAIPLLVPLAVAACGGGIGWIVTLAGSKTIFSAIAGSTTAVCVSAVGLFVFYRPGFLDLARILWRSVQETFRPARAAVGSSPG